MTTVSWNLLPNWPAYPTVDRGRPSGVTVHRIDVAAVSGPQGDSYSPDGEGIARFFAEHPDGRRATGGKMAFSLLVSPAGTIEQVLPLDRRTPHAYSFDATHLGVACIGDFRIAAMPAAQRGALVGLCAELGHIFGFGSTSVLSHSEAADLANKRDPLSPGGRVDMAALRRDITVAFHQPEWCRETFELLHNADEVVKAGIDKASQLSA